MICRSTFSLVPVAIVFLIAFFVNPASLRAENAFPLERLQLDWLFQDHGLDLSDCFTNTEHCEVERNLLQKVVSQIGESGTGFLQKASELAEAKIAGSDPRWKELYFEACEARRESRLKALFEKYPRIVYTKHAVLGASHYAYTENPTDAQKTERNSDYRFGAQLCLLTLSPEGNVVSEVLYETKTGILRDPDVSYDGKRVLFSMRHNDSTDDYHLYELELAKKSLRQLTDGLGFADIEPCYLPDGNILFTSTRCMQIVDCWWLDVSNFYMIDKDGHLMRRVGFDQVHTNYPTVLEDGRVIYTRWDYNDRGQIFPQPLFFMNFDGTGQTEFYGNNSWFPTTVLHARGIPDSPKVVAVASGHHTHQRGKLILIDRTKGTQEAAGVQMIAPIRETAPERIDHYGQGGEQFQYPYPLDETHYLVAFSPEGFPAGRYDPPFGLYFMDIDGNRELLAFDPTISSGQPVPLAARAVPQLRASAVDFGRETGTFYVQDIYAGPGLEGIERGTIESIRIVALEFRAAGIGSNGNGGPAGAALVSTPVSYNNGAWDPKIVLGTVPVEDDGSAYFEVPARTPVYFQMLDKSGHVVQTMRSWSTLQPGEMFSCIGCHENKSDTLRNERPTVRKALRKRPRKPEPLIDPSRGFSFVREIQPILDTHCLGCHTDGKNDDGTDAPFSLLGNSYVPQNQAEIDLFRGAGRDFSESYLNLIHKGQSNEIVNWISPQSVPSMLPPYSAGAAKSKLLKQFEEGHNDVRLSDREKRILACWIDLLVPYCGDYLEANLWSEEQKAEYAYYQNKRDRMSEIERENIALLLDQAKAEELLLSGEEEENVVFPTLKTTVFDAGGREAKARFTEKWLNQRKNLPIFGRAGNGQNEYRNLALNPNASQGEPSSYPHASSNSEYASLPEYAAKNAIDGQTANKGHGKDFPSWGPNKRTDLWWSVDFGRPVEVDKVVITLRADFPHDSAWTSAVLEFSDGSREPITFQKTDRPQEFAFAKRTTGSLKITDLKQDRPLGWCGLSEVEVWGRDRD